MGKDGAMTRITVLPNGPYLVTENVPLVRKSQIETAAGEPVAWATGDRLDDGEKGYALCRCGQSANKPFCDGTHKSVGFTGECSASGTYAERAKSYEGPGVTIHDDRSVCVHAGFCGTAATNVWKMVKRTDDTNVLSQVIAMVERCPSGALTYTVAGMDHPNDPGLAEQIGVCADGPLWAVGGLSVAGADGTEYETRRRVTLCRCGASANKPLCDGTHKEIGFSD
jgi:CDGSH-type Zn-finger protein